jgi:MFS family permease
VDALRPKIISRRSARQFLSLAPLTRSALCSERSSAYPGGIVVDRWGFRFAFVAFNLLSIVGYASCFSLPNWGAVICATFLFLSWTCFSLPASFSLIAETLEANRHSMGIGMQSVIKRLPIMIAPFLGRVLIDHSNDRGRSYRVGGFDRHLERDDCRAMAIATGRVDDSRALLKTGAFGAA